MTPKAFVKKYLVCPSFLQKEITLALEGSGIFDILTMVVLGASIRKIDSVSPSMINECFAIAISLLSTVWQKKVLNVNKLYLFASIRNSFCQ